MHALDVAREIRLLAARVARARTAAVTVAADDAVNSVVEGGSGSGGPAASAADAAECAVVEAAATAALTRMVRAGEHPLSEAPPLGAPLHYTIKQILHAAADGPAPAPEAVAIVDAHVAAYARRVLVALRSAQGRDVVRASDFAVAMPETTRIFFRWKLMRAMGAAADGGDAAAVQAAADAAAVSTAVDEDAQSIDVAALDDINVDDDVLLVDDAGAPDVVAPVAASAPAAARMYKSTRSMPSVAVVSAASAAAAAAQPAEDDDADEARKMSLLQAAAEEDFRRAAGGAGASAAADNGGSSWRLALAAAAGSKGGAGAAAAAALPATGVPATQLLNGVAHAAPEDCPSAATTSAGWQTFLARLAFANLRSAAMTSLQYAIYGRCREAGFTSTPRVKAAFARLLPPPALADGALEVLAFIAYDRVASVAEAANRIANHSSAAPVHTMATLPRAAYEEALCSQLPLPAELHELFQAAAARSRAQQAAAAGEIGGPGAQPALPPRRNALPPTVAPNTKRRKA